MWKETWTRAGFYSSPGNNGRRPLSPPDSPPTSTPRQPPGIIRISGHVKNKSLCMECMAEPGLEPRPYKMHSPRLSRNVSTGGQIKWVEGPSGFLEDGENQSKAGEEEKNSHSSRGGAGFHSFLHMPPFPDLVSRAPRASARLQQVWGGVICTLDRTLRLEFVRSCKETGALGRHVSSRSAISSSEPLEPVHTHGPTVVAGRISLHWRAYLEEILLRGYACFKFSQQRLESCSHFAEGKLRAHLEELRLHRWLVCGVSTDL